MDAALHRSGVISGLVPEGLGGLWLETRTSFQTQQAGALVEIHVGRFDAKKEEAALNVIKKHGFCGMGIFLLEPQEFLPDGLGVMVFVKDALFGLFTQEHGARNGSEAPDAAALPEKDAVCGSVRLLQLPEYGLHLVRGGEEIGDHLVGEKGDDTLETAAGAYPGLKTGAPAKGAEILLLVFHQVLTELKVRVHALCQFLQFEAGEVSDGFLDGFEAGPLIPIVFAHAV